MKYLIPIAMTALVAACSSVAPEKEAPPVQLANPASQFCVQSGGTLRIEKTPAGEAGICVLPDGQEIDEWELFRSSQASSTQTASQAVTDLQAQQQQLAAKADADMARLQEATGAQARQATQNYEQANAKAATLLGVNPEESNYLAGKHASRLADLDARADALEEKLRDKMTWDEDDNLFTWFAGILTAGPTKIALDATNTATAGIHNRIALAEAAARDQYFTNNAIKQTMDAASIERAATIAEAEYVQMRNLANKENAMFQADALAKIAEITNNQLSILQAQANQKIQEQQNQRAIEAAANERTRLPKVNVVRYRCEPQQNVTVTYFVDQERAQLERAGATVELKQQPSGSGFIYSNGPNTIRGKGDDLTLEIGRMAAIQCKAV